jgi:hypothetical protein
MLSYVSQHGYLDGIVRGYRCLLLTSAQYNSLTLAESIEGNH